MAARETAISAGPARIVQTSDENELAAILDAGVAAVIHTPDPMPPWMAVLGEALAAIEGGGGRAALADGTRADVRSWFADWLDAVLPQSLRTGDAHTAAVVDDVVHLADVITALAGVSRFRVRALLGPPTTDCGFHVDTVPPAAPSWGLLRVYNGAGTLYADPADIVDGPAFRRYLVSRERLERHRSSARRDGDPGALARVDAQMAELDAARPFLRDGATVRVVPAGSIVAFRHTDAAEYWSDGALTRGWIHCSPMHGEPRLVVNITSPQVAPQPSRAAAPPQG